MHRAVRLFQPPPDGASSCRAACCRRTVIRSTFVARDNSSGETALWVRALHSRSSSVSEHTEGASKPFWSPDSGRLGFVSNGELGDGRQLRDGAVADRGVRRHRRRRRHVGARRTILFADWAKGLYAVRASRLGAHARRRARSSRAATSRSAWPQFLPDGRHFLYQVVSLDAARMGRYVGDLDTRHSVRLLDTESPASFAAASPAARAARHADCGGVRREHLGAHGRATRAGARRVAAVAGGRNVVSAAGDLIAYRGVSASAARRGSIAPARCSRRCRCRLMFDPRVRRTAPPRYGRGDDESWALAREPVDAARVRAPRDRRNRPLWSPTARASRSRHAVGSICSFALRPAGASRLSSAASSRF